MKAKDKKSRTIKRTRKKQIWRLGEFVAKLAREKQASKKSEFLP